MNKYCVHIGYRMTTDVFVITESEERAKELAENYAESIPLTDSRFSCADSDADVWRENFDEDEADVVDEEYEEEVN